MEYRWSSSRLDTYVRRFLELIFNFQEKVDDAIAADRYIVQCIQELHGNGDNNNNNNNDNNKNNSNSNNNNNNNNDNNNKTAHSLESYAAILNKIQDKIDELEGFKNMDVWVDDINTERRASTHCAPETVPDHLAQGLCREG